MYEIYNGKYESFSNVLYAHYLPVIHDSIAGYNET